MSNTNHVHSNENDQSSSTPDTERDRMLVEFLHKYGGDCPVCGYNLNALTRPICPECGQHLTLAVGAMRLTMGWLFVALAPGFFSGICAAFVLIPIVGRVFFGDGRMSLTLNVVDLFGCCSGLFAIYLAINRIRFLRQTRKRQKWIALGIWMIHIMAFGLLLLIGPKYM